MTNCSWISAQHSLGGAQRGVGGGGVWGSAPQGLFSSVDGWEEKFSSVSTPLCLTLLFPFQGEQRRGSQLELAGLEDNEQVSAVQSPFSVKVHSRELVHRKNSDITGEDKRRKRNVKKTKKTNWENHTDRTQWKVWSLKAKITFKKSWEFRSQFQVQKEQQKKKLEKLTSGEERESDLEKHTFAEWVYFCFYTKLTGFWYHIQHRVFSLKGTNCAVSRRGSFGTDFRQVQRNMKSESTRQPPLALTTGSHLLPVNLHHCESSEGEACYISVAKNGLSVMTQYQFLLLIINGCLPLRALQCHNANDIDA